VIVTGGRTGSNLLVFALRDHPNVKIYGEIFNPSEEIRKKWYQTEGLSRYYKEGESGEQFLKSYIYKSYQSELRAVGFKMIYFYTLEDTRIKSVWNYLIENREIRIIQLKRRNYLDILVSQEVAFRTRNWILLSQEEKNIPTLDAFSLAPEYCEKFFDRLASKEKWIQEIFKEHPFIEVYYSDLCNKFQDIVNQIHDFLSVPRYKAFVHTKKQQKKLSNMQLENFSELKDYFKKSKHSFFFE
jgi:hypothetical protein